MGVPISSSDVRVVLANADMAARNAGDVLATKAELDPWREAISSLARDRVPKTYLAVLAILLTARSLYPPAELDVRDIKQSTSDKGFSASSVGSTVASFAKEHQVDLRATSSQPMNNQPFTFKERITAEMPVNVKFEHAWQEFYRLVERVDALSVADARDVLALLFHLRRRAAATVLMVSDAGDREAYLATRERIAALVRAESESGRVGQAFAAALMDCVYGWENVQQGNAQDPDASKVGDVHVARDGDTWMWIEVKQKVIATGDISEFVAKVKEWGGERAMYLALSNESYSGNINQSHVDRQASRKGVDLLLVTSPEAAMEAVLNFAPGVYGQVAADLVARMHARLLEAGCSASLMSEFVDEVVDPLAEAADLP